MKILLSVIMALGLMAPVGSSDRVVINQELGSESGLDVCADSTGLNAMMRLVNKDGIPRTQFNGEGMFYTNGWAVISGTMECYPLQNCSWRPAHPTPDPFMLGVWSDVDTAMVLRQANMPAENAFTIRSLGRDGNDVWAVRGDGRLMWGATDKQHYDTSLSRRAPGHLATEGTLEAARLTVGGDVSWTKGKGVPPGPCVSGSIYSRLDGGANSTLYVCEFEQWVAK